MTGVDRFQLRERVRLGLDAVSQLQQQLAALGGGHAAPDRKCALGSGDRGIDVGRFRFRDPRDQRIVMRVQHVDRRAIERVDKFAADEELVLNVVHGKPVFG